MILLCKEEFLNRNPHPQRGRGWLTYHPFWSTYGSFHCVLGRGFSQTCIICIPAAYIYAYETPLLCASTVLQHVKILLRPILHPPVKPTCTFIMTREGLGPFSMRTARLANDTTSTTLTVAATSRVNHSSASLVLKV